jgi:hypothetical protein
MERVYFPDPQHTLASWWDSLPPEMAAHVACQASFVLVPQIFPEPLYDEADTARFRAEIVAPVKGAFEKAGRALTFAGAIDFVLATQSTREDWEGQERWQRQAASAMAEKGNDRLAQMLNETADQASFRGAMWAREAERWIALRAGLLSPAAIKAYVMGYSVPVK